MAHRVKTIIILLVLQFIVSTGVLNPVFADQSSENCQIKRNYRTYTTTNRASYTGIVTQSGEVTCQRVNQYTYKIYLNGQTRYVHRSAIIRTSEQTFAVQGNLRPRARPTTVQTSESTDVSTVAQMAEANLSTRTLESEGWIPVRAEPNRDSRFDCSVAIEGNCHSARHQVASINQDVTLLPTGEREFDEDHNEWYFKANFEHDGRPYSGWFAEKQTEVDSADALARASTERRVNDWLNGSSGTSFGISSEVAGSDPVNYQIPMDTESEAQRAVYTNDRNADFEVQASDIPKSEDESLGFGPPVCDCAENSCRVSSAFGPRRQFRTTNGGQASRNHRAWDIAGATGTPILAIEDGVIISARRERGYGRTIRVDYGNGLVVRYSHLNSYSIRSGTVRKGQQIGTLGASGNVTGPNLDIGFILNGTPVNPGLYMPNDSSFFNQSCRGL